MEELPISVDENCWEIGIRQILLKIRPNWSKEDITFKVSHFILIYYKAKKRKVNK